MTGGAVLEYRMELSIRDRKGLTVGEYENTRIAVEEGMKAFFLARSPGELRDGERMTNLVNNEIRALTEGLSPDGLEIFIEYAYMPPTGEDIWMEADKSMGEGMRTETGGGPERDMDADLAGDTEEEREWEDRNFPYGTLRDYESLFRLMTPDYGTLSLAEFNAPFLDWCNEDGERMERVGVDMFRRDQMVSLTEEELHFAGLTAQLSREENYRRITAEKTGKPEEDPRMSLGRMQKQNDETGAWCTLDVRFSWHVTDRNLVTVEERDRCVEGMSERIRQFWEENTLSTLIGMNEAEVTALFEEYAEECGGSGIRLHVDEDMIKFEHRGPGE